MRGKSTLRRSVALRTGALDSQFVGNLKNTRGAVGTDAYYVPISLGIYRTVECHIPVLNGDADRLAWVYRVLRERRVNDSPGFDTKSVVYRYSQTLLAANIAFCGLHRDMPEKKLDLLEFASRIMAEPRTGPPEIMWRETWNVHARGSLLDNVPDCLF